MHRSCSLLTVLIVYWSDIFASVYGIIPFGEWLISRLESGDDRTKFDMQTTP